jgi:thioesterase domain-containing protein/acyl carrier protein
MVPSAFVTLAAMPLTPNGKVDRKALPAPESAMAGERAYVAPRDETEQRLAEIWAELLEVERVGVTDDFFAIGGHSLVAVRVVARVRRELGRDLPLVALFRDPTIRGLAALVRDPGRLTPRSALVEIQAGGTEPPFFCVHPVGGTVFAYVDLARQLGPDQPFYGFQVPEDGAEELTTVEALAARYVSELLTARPEGPYRLGGWSMGGLVAFEMAWQLTERGKTVERLILLDTDAPAPEPPGEPEDEAILLGDFALDLVGTAGGTVDLSATAFDLSQIGGEGALARLFEQAQAAGILPPEMSFEETIRLYSTYARNRRAMRLYRGRPLPVEVTLFTAEARGPALATDPLLGWSALASRVEAREVPGDHYSMLRAPQVERLAEFLRDCLVIHRDSDVERPFRRSS